MFLLRLRTTCDMLRPPLGCGLEGVFLCIRTNVPCLRWVCPVTLVVAGLFSCPDHLGPVLRNTTPASLSIEFIIV